MPATKLIELPDLSVAQAGVSLDTRGEFGTVRETWFVDLDVCVAGEETTAWYTASKHRDPEFTLARVKVVRPALLFGQTAEELSEDIARAVIRHAETHLGDA